MAPEPRCRTGRSLADWVARSCCGSRTPTRRGTDPSGRQGIIDALAWIGISADDPHFEGPHFQSEFADAHIAAARKLYDDGHAYYCDLTGEQIQQRSKELGLSGYDGYSRDRGLEPAPGRVLRFRVPEGTTVVHDLVRGDVTFENDTIEDFVLLRGNGTPVFLLANVVDDIEMAITDVVRAEEHLPNTPKQQMLWEALGRQPPRWGHVPVLVNEQRKKLSKRRDKVALEQYRDDGYLADAMVNYLMTLGWTPPGAEAAGSEIVSWDEIEAAFRLEDVTHSPAFFDIKKLAAFNGDYIRQMPLAEFIERADAELPADWNRARFAAIAPHIQERLTTLNEVPGQGRLPVLARWPTDRLRDGVVGQGVHARVVGAAAGRRDRGLPHGPVGGRRPQGSARIGHGVVFDQVGQGAGAGSSRRHRPDGRPAAVRIARSARP